MTPEERAERAIYGLVLKLRTEIEEARAAAYEDCARIVEGIEGDLETLYAIAAAIRARAQEGG